MVTVDPPSLRQLVAEIVHETLALAVPRDGKLSPERLSYTETEAAAAMGVQKHVLRDCRLRGQIAGQRMGKRVVYARDELLRFLNARQEDRRA